ncbi:MAG: phosphoribosyl-AMP cyclohydrolase [Methanocalculus sp.]|uniref:phosphoribosyl-AMP cyclohydrolase n=1 Tax=Methanocalculus sp. TaxID=2004547 RepID=UPI002716367C|nr:phosphoribosyl-AMP cyclohydrolase [Methanocalculus sp.]MDO9538676.1 phosphoribosyl-AMP cyclohydrolase [Methanocalculus sp.]
MDIEYQNGLVPVVVQDYTTLEVLMVAWADDEAVRLTMETGYAHYYSRSRKKIWKKGEESGHIQRVHQIRTDCDADTLLYLVSQSGAACHMGYRSCFFRTIEGEVLLDRIVDPKKVYNNTNE